MIGLLLACGFKCRFAPFAFPYRGQQFSSDLARFTAVKTGAEFGAQFLDLLFNRHLSLLDLAKDEGFARGGMGRVKDREAAA